MLGYYENKWRIFFLSKRKQIHATTVAYNDISSLSPDIYDDIFTGKMDYLLIKNFIQPDELNYLKNTSIQQLKTSSFRETTKSGCFLGKSLLEKNTLGDYFTSAENYNKQEKDLLGFSFNNRISALLRKISRASDISIPQNAKGIPYTGNTLRILEADKVAFPPHTDKYVHDIHPKSEELKNMISDDNLISFFALINKPEEGGRLFLFDKHYKDTPPEILHELSYGNYTKVQKYIYRHDCIRIDMNEGDLVLFDAGQRWHMIEPVSGKTDRITIGCFTSYSKDRNSIYFWS
jgi:hypothetical protein